MTLLVDIIRRTIAFTRTRYVFSVLSVRVAREPQSDLWKPRRYFNKTQFNLARIIIATIIRYDIITTQITTHSAND